MKPYGIGLVLLLIAFAIGLYSAYLNYNWTQITLSRTPFTGTSWTDAERQAWANDLRTTALIGLVSSILAIAGALVLLIEFMKHKHPHEHEVSAPRILPPPP